MQRALGVRNEELLREEGQSLAQLCFRSLVPRTMGPLIFPQSQFRLTAGGDQ